MKLITRKKIKKEHIERIRKYMEQRWPDKDEREAGVRDIHGNRTVLEVEEHIGNMYAYLVSCTECKAYYKEVVVQLGEEPCMGSKTVMLCRSCLNEALVLLQAAAMVGDVGDDGGTEIVTDKFIRFAAALKQICWEYKVCLTPSESEPIQVWDFDPVNDIEHVINLVELLEDMTYGSEGYKTAIEKVRRRGGDGEN